MAEAKTLRRILERIRDDAQHALNALGDSGEPRFACMEMQRLRPRQTFYAAGSGGGRAAVSKVRERIISGPLNLLTNGAPFSGPTLPRKMVLVFGGDLLCTSAAQRGARYHPRGLSQSRDRARWAELTGLRP